MNEENRDEAETVDMELSDTLDEHIKARVTIELEVTTIQET